MAKTYYDSAFTGSEIDAAIRTANVIREASVPENAGKLLSFAADGSLTTTQPPEGYDDTSLSGRVAALEETVSGLLDATGVSF